VFDRHLRPLIDPPLSAAGRMLARRGVSAGAVTAAGLVFSLLAGVAVALGATTAALALLAASRLADGLDGAVARAHAATGTDLGGYLDILADFVFYAAVPLGFVLTDPAANGAAGAFLLAAFYINAASFLGFAAIAEKRRLQTDANGRKAFFHATGLLEGSETIAFFVLVCLIPAWFAPLAWAFGALCLLTVALRLRLARALFGP
jgi:phosphatidylglycerophosphate synthase